MTTQQFQVVSSKVIEAAAEDGKFLSEKTITNGIGKAQVLRAVGDFKAGDSELEALYNIYLKEFRKAKGK